MSALSYQYTARDRSTALRMRAAGASDDDIAAAVGRSRASVSVHLCRWRKAGYDVAPAVRGRHAYGAAHLDVGKVRDLLDVGTRVKEVARLLGLTPARMEVRT